MEIRGKIVTYTAMSELEKGLRYLGYFCDSQDLPKTKIKRYRQISYTPETAIGLIVHSCTSDYPEGIFYTDGNIIYTKNRPEKMGTLDASTERDIVKEHIIVEIIDANVVNLDVYYTGAGDCVFNLFEASFGGFDQNTLYGKTIKKLSRKYSGLITSEKQKIAERIQLNKDVLDHVMAITANDITCTHIHTKLVENLSCFGYCVSH